MNKTKIAKYAIKAALGFTVSAGIGYAIKLEKKLDIKIDELWPKNVTN